jgi:hypothetical protein
MTGRAAELALVTGLALVLTLAIAVPVLRAPTERIFGMEIVGRHYDPFTVMEQFAQPIRLTAVLQPVTDLPGAVLARFVGVVPAYTVLVLLSFPLTALTAYLLARHCGLIHVSATGAALAVAFSPFHVAQAAYHPQVAQLQWLPLYLLALWRCLDSPTPGAVALLVCASVGVSLSNFYGGLIAIAISPIAIAAYWFFKMRPDTTAVQRVLVTSAVLSVVAIGGAGYAWYAAREAFQPASYLSFSRGDVVKYAAAWRSYLSPPVAQPWFRQLTRTADPALLEQQLSLGWALVALSAVAVTAWLRERARLPAWSPVPVLVALGAFALVCSVSPTTWLYGLLPMFRSYARFGSVVQLTVALLAGIGAERLWRSPSRGARWLVVALVVMAGAEYAVWPPHLWRDVLPTAAHRWIAQQPVTTRALDCYPYSRESQSVQWLSGGRIILRPSSIADCREPGVVATLAANGFTHMLIRRSTPESQWFERQPPPAGLALVARFADGEVLAVLEPPSLIRTIRIEGFYPAEFDPSHTWRWMKGSEGSWIVVNISARALMASVDIETGAFHEPRHLSVVLDGAAVEDVVIEPDRAIHRIGPFALGPGEHTLLFRVVSAPTIADALVHNGDPRPLSVAFGDWRWSVDGGQR